MFIIINIFKKKMNIIKYYNNKYLLLDDTAKLTLLHRWCNTTSPKYKNICNWEKKLDNAQIDNCYTNQKDYPK